MNRLFAKIISVTLLLGTVLCGGALAAVSDTPPEDSAETDETRLDIRQIQYMRGAEGSLVSFEEGENPQLLVPMDLTRTASAVFSDGTVSATLYEHAVDNVVVVENVLHTDEKGKTTSLPCWFRTVIAVESPEGLSEGVDVCLLRNEEGYAWSKAADGVSINGVMFDIYVAEYLTVLEPGEVSEPSLLQVYLPPEATSADGALIGGTLEVSVVSQAVQSEGFERTTAMAQLGEISAESHPYKEYSALVRWLRELFT